MATESSQLAALERRRMMLFLTAILLVVSMSSTLASALHYRPHLIEGVWRRDLLLALGETLVLVIAGGTLLVRVCNPFIRRLEKVNHRLEIKAEQLAKTNRELEDLSYIASHDLKEPLRGISSYCQILLEDYGERLDADGQRRLKALVTLCQRLSQLIDDVLAYSQLGRNLPEATSDADLHAIACDVLETLGPAIDRRGASVQVTGQLPRLPADRVWVGEVFRNLVSNALKFNDSSQAHVEIGSLDNGTLFVRDNGIGIPACHHEAIFAMFRRLYPRSQYEGTGAGLSFVRKIVEAHGGRVWVESEPGQGATFFFTLTSEASTSAMSTPVVLLVEDSEDDVEFAIRALACSGVEHELVVAREGAGRCNWSLRPTTIPSPPTWCCWI